MLAYILHRRDTFDDTYDLQGLVLSPFQSHEPNNRRKSRVLLDSKVDVGELQRLSEVSVLIVRSKMRTKLIEEAKGWLRGEKNEMAKRGKFDELRLKRSLQKDRPIEGDTTEYDEVRRATSMK